MKLEQLAALLLDPNPPPATAAWPLSLLAFLRSAHALRLPGQLSPRLSERPRHGRCAEQEALDTEIRRAVKPKKMHEIVRLSRLADEVARA